MGNPVKRKPVMEQGQPLLHTTVPNLKAKRGPKGFMRILLSGGGGFRCRGITARGGCILLCPMTEHSLCEFE